MRAYRYLKFGDVLENENNKFIYMGTFPLGEKESIYYLSTKLKQRNYTHYGIVLGKEETLTDLLQRSKIDIDTLYLFNNYVEDYGYKYVKNIAKELKLFLVKYKLVDKTGYIRDFFALETELADEKEIRNQIEERLHLFKKNYPEICKTKQGSEVLYNGEKYIYLGFDSVWVTNDIAVMSATEEVLYLNLNEKFKILSNKKRIINSNFKDCEDLFC